MSKDIRFLRKLVKKAYDECVSPGIVAIHTAKGAAVSALPAGASVAANIALTI